MAPKRALDDEEAFVDSSQEEEEEDEEYAPAPKRKALAIKKSRSNKQKDPIKTDLDAITDFETLLSVAKELQVLARAASKRGGGSSSCTTSDVNASRDAATVKRELKKNFKSNLNWKRLQSHGTRVEFKSPCSVTAAEVILGNLEKKAVTNIDKPPAALFDGELTKAMRYGGYLEIPGPVKCTFSKTTGIIRFNASILVNKSGASGFRGW